MYKCIVCILLSLLLISCDAGKPEQQASENSAPKQQYTPAIKVETRAVEIRPLKVVMEGSGITYPFRVAEVAASLEGSIISVNFVEGQKVKEKDVLAKIDDYEWQSRVNEKKAEYSMLEAELLRLETGYLPEEIAQKQAAVREVEAQLRQLSLEKTRKQELHKNRSISATEWEQIEYSYAAKEAELQKVIAEFKIYKNGYREELKKIARAELKKVEAQLNYELSSLEKTIVKAPFSGVIGKKNVEIGQWVDDNTNVATILDLNKIKVETYVPEKYVSLVKQGLIAEVLIEALPSQKFSAEVIEVVPQATVPGHAFPVRLLVDNPNMVIKAGMYCRVSGILREEPQAIMIHRDAVMRKDRKAYTILVTKDNKAEHIPIRTGARDGDWLEVVYSTHKWQKDDHVVVTNNPNVQTGTKIEVTKVYP